MSAYCEPTKRGIGSAVEAAERMAAERPGQDGS